MSVLEVSLTESVLVDTRCENMLEPILRADLGSVGKKLGCRGERRWDWRHLLGPVPIRGREGTKGTKREGGKLENSPV